MIKLIDYSDLERSIQRIKSIGRGFLTNCFLSPERITDYIEADRLILVECNNCTFLIKENIGFKNLYFFTSTLEDLKIGLILINALMKNEHLIIDIVGTSQVKNLVDIFLESSFKIYTYLVRMSRLNLEYITDFDENLSLNLAVLKDVPEMLLLFNNYFDPISEQIPDQNDLIKWIEKKGIMTYKEDGKIIGFIIFEITGLTSYLRYWFVHPDHRDKKIGSSLFNYYKYRSKNTKRQLFWVINTNDNAIKRYEHYGFSSEKLFNFVLTNKHNNDER